MAGTVNEADLSYQIFQDYRGPRDEWAKAAAHYEDFFYGVQYTHQEVKDLESRGMAPLVVNRTMPVIQQEMSMFLAKRPQFKYFPVDDTADVDTAAVFNDAAQHVWHISNGDSEYQQTMQDYFVVGAGYMQAYIDPHADEGRGEVMVKSLPPWDVYPDPNSRAIDLSDARFIIVSRLIDRETLIFMYPDEEEKIKQAAPEDGPNIERPEPHPNNLQASSRATVSFNGSKRQKDKVRVIERYEKIRVRRYKIFDAMNGTTYKTDDLPEDINETLTNPRSSIRSMPIWETAIKITVSVGTNTVLEQYNLLMDVYPIVPFYLHHRRNPFPIGDVAVIYGMQQETNKRRSIMLHNATLSGNFRMIAPKGSITNKEDFEKRGTTPGFLIEYMEIGGQPPRELLPQQLSPAWVQLEQEAKGDIEYSLSVFSHMMGAANDAPETYRSLLALEERGQQKIQYKAKHARHALRILGIAVMQLIQMTYSPQKILRVVGEDNEPAKRVIANGIVFDAFTGKRKAYNTLDVGKYDLIVADGTSMPTNRMAMSNMMMDMYQMGLVDKQEVWKRLDLPDREKLAERMSEMSQMQAQMAQLQDSLKSLEGLNQTLRRQLQQAEIHLGAQKVVAQIKDDQANVAIQNDIARGKIQNELAMMKANIALTTRETQSQMASEAQQHADELAFIRLRAELEAEVERERLALDAERAKLAAERAARSAAKS